MSQRSWGWVIGCAGLWSLGIGAWVLIAGTFEIGAGLMIFGAFTFGAGVCAVTEPWRDSVDEEIDRWEANWSSEWSPACSVHGKNLCLTRTRACPAVRERVS